MEQQQKIWLDGELVPWKEANVHVTSYGMLLGIGFFEALRCFETESGSALFRPHDHLRRLEDTAHTYMRPLQRSRADLLRACKDVLNANELKQAYLRVLVFLGEGENPVAAEFRTAVIATASGPYMSMPAEGGVSAKISSIQRPTVNSIPPAAKATGQYLNATLAQLDAMAAGYEVAILQNQAGMVVDGWINNVFSVRDGKLRTPPVSAGALAGITRDSVITLARDRDLPVVEADLIRTDLYTADEVFLTGTQAGIVPVVSVDRRQVGDGKPGELTRRLGDAFEDAIHGRDEDHSKWLEAVGSSDLSQSAT